MNGHWAIPVLASIVILGLLGFSHDAYAVSGTISDQTSCQAIGGTWITPNRCHVTALTINVGETLVVSSGIILDNTGTINNNLGGNILNSDLTSQSSRVDSNKSRSS